jgi:hypothetical protein
MSTSYQGSTGQANSNQVSTEYEAVTLDPMPRNGANQVNTEHGAVMLDPMPRNGANQVSTDYGAVMLDPMPRNGANQVSTEHGAVMLDLNRNSLERHIAEAKIQLNIARDQLRTLVKANRDLIAGNVTSYTSTGSVTIGGVLYTVIESKFDFGTRLEGLRFNGTLGGLPVGVNGYNGGAEFFLSPDQLAALGTIDVQVDATPVQCFICWRHNTRILGAFYGTGSGVSGFGASGNGTFKQIS